MMVYYSSQRLYYHEIYIQFESKNLLTKVSRELKILKESTNYCDNNLMFCIALALGKSESYSPSSSDLFAETYSYSHHTTLSQRLKLVLKSKHRAIFQEKLIPFLLLFEGVLSLHEIVVKTEVLDSFVFENKEALC
jgi:hypothetical protein